MVRKSVAKETSASLPGFSKQKIEDVFTPAQKQEMIEKLTDAMVNIEGETMRQVTWVYIEDVKQGEFGIGGQHPLPPRMFTDSNGARPPPDAKARPGETARLARPATQRRRYVRTSGRNLISTPCR
jgi:4-oxalocrotonate tautomerase